MMGVMGASYLAGAFVGRALSFGNTFAAVWPPNALLVAVLIRSDVRLWPYLVLATCPANVAFNAWRGQLLLVSVAYWMANMATSVAIAGIVRRVHGRIALDRLVQVAGFALAVALSTMVGAVIGAAVIHLSNPAVRIAAAWRSWWMGDLFSILVVAPVIIAFPWRRVGAEPVRVSRECVAYGVALAAATAATVSAPLVGVDARLLVQLLAIPLLGWSSLRLGVAGTTWAVLVVSFLVVWNHVRGVGEFVSPLGFTADGALAVHAILSGLSLTFLGIAAAVQETRDSALRLQRRDETRKAFLAAMAHEIRNPLSIILASVEVAEDRSADRGALAPEEPLRAIEGAARQILEVVEDTLQVSQTEGEPAPQLEPVWLPALWRDLHTECRTMQRGADVALRWKLPGPDVTVLTDPKRVRTMVRNLVGNALKFTDRGQVSVECRADDHTVTFVVEDTGIGIPAPDRERIFELFHRGSDPEHQRRHGTGVGLYLVRRYAVECGGTVTLTSAPRQGSVFTLTLPRVIAKSRVA
jgi:signal transduction histidine kinase